MFSAVLQITSKYMVMFREQNVGRSYSTKADNCSFAMVEQFK